MIIKIYSKKIINYQVSSRLLILFKKLDLIIKKVQDFIW